MEGSILELLEQHGSLADEQIAAHLNLPPDQVRSALTDLRVCGWIEALKIGHHPEPNRPAYWHLTGGGHEELARRRRAGQCGASFRTRKHQLSQGCAKREAT